MGKRALALEGSARYPEGHAFAAEVQRLLAGEAPVASGFRPAAARVRRRRAFLYGALALAALAWASSEVYRSRARAREPDG